MAVPYTIATLPKPLDSIHGGLHAAPVHTWHNSRKRKRHEVVVGIDGESVNIYSVQTQSLLAAYAIAPNSYLCSSPSSTYSRPTEAKRARRDTYFVLRGSLKDKNRRLVHFSEQLSSPGEFAAPVRSEHGLREGEILSVDALGSHESSEDGSSHALVSYVKGHVHITPGSSSSSAWSGTILRRDEATIASVEHASTIDLDVAKGGLLKSREDIVERLISGPSSAPLLAYFVVRKGDSRSLRLFSLNTPPGTAGLEQLDDLDLPSANYSHTGPSSWELDAGSGLLTQLVDGIVHLYDLSGIAPRPVLTLKDGHGRIKSVLETSGSSVLTLVDDNLTMYETKYGSIQAAATLQSGTTSDGPGRKRKRDDDPPISTNVSLVAAFPDLNVITAISTDLIGLQLQSQALSVKRTKTGSILLSDIFGKGTQRHVNGQSNEEDTIDRHARRWKRWRDHIDQLAEAGDVVAFEQFVGKDLNFAPSSEAHQRPPNEDIDSTQTGEVTDPWDLEAGPHDLTVRQKKKALYLLGKVFGQDAAIRDSVEGRRPLRVRISARNVIRWLAVTDVLSAENLTQGLGRAVTWKDIAQAIGDADNSFHLLHDMLTLPIHLPLAFVVEGLRLLIRSLDTPTASTATPSNQIRNELDETMSDADSQLDVESRTAELELSQALTALESGLEVRSATLRLIFGRLHAFPQSQRSKHLRLGLQQRDLVFFIHLLRIELADAGWTERYVDNSADTHTAASTPLSAQTDAEDEAANSPSTQLIVADEEQEGESETGPSDSAIRAIGNLLVAAVDAIGLSGWLVGISGDDAGGDGLLEALRAEVAATVEGVYEAHALGRYLDEFERYAARAERQRGGAKNAVVESDEGALLPMGGLSEIVIPKESDGAGGKGRGGADSARARARSRVVGLYEFERIRI